jgi:hypothetical protein
VSAEGAEVLDLTAGGLTPFAPRRFGPAVREPVAVKEGDDGLPLIAGVPALALLLGAGLLGARRAARASRAARDRP